MRAAQGPLTAIVGLAGVVTGLFVCFFLAKVTNWGHFIPSANIASDYAAALCTAVIVLVSIFAWPVSFSDRRILAMLWAFRCTVTLGLMLVYEDNYGLDAYTYFLEAQAMNFNWETVGFGLGTGNVGLLVWYLNHLIPFSDSYHSLKVLFSLVGFVGIYIFYRAVCFYSGRSWPALLLFLGCFPSLVFWSSILGKDPVIIFGICLYSAGMLYWLKTRNPIFLLLALGGMGVASWIRPWSAMILAVPMVIVGFSSVKGVFTRAFYAISFSAALFYSAQLFVSHFSLIGIDDLVHKTNAISKAWSIGGSRQEVPEFSSLYQMLLFAPQGMFTAIFRPLPGEVNNAFGLLAGLENLFLLGLALLAIKRISREKLKVPGVIWAFAFLLTWSFVYGFVSYQNLGSAFRFRLQIVPVLLTLLLFLVHRPVQSPSER